MARVKSNIRSRSVGLAGLGKKYGEIAERGSKTRLLFLELYSLFKISSTFSDKMDMAETLKAIKKIIHEVFPCEQFFLLLMDEETDELILSSHFGLTKRDIDRVPHPAGDQLFARVMKSRRPIYLKNLATARKRLAYQPGRKIKNGALLAMPLLADGIKPVGAIGLYRKAPDSFAKDEIELLRKIAGQAALVIDRLTQYQHHRELSMTDELTGIFNRRYFNQRFDREMLRAQRYERPLTVIMIDIDHFKTFNDAHGHLMGDQVLKGVADLLEHNLRKADILARFGGEEFVIILPEIDKDRGRKVAEKLRRAVERAEFPKEETQPLGRLTISLGLASFPEDSSRAPDLLERADRALYLAKTLGRNQVAVGQPTNGNTGKARHAPAMAAADKATADK
jgi:diguanylate cyclase (GGDEF)-like protein